MINIIIIKITIFGKINIDTNKRFYCGFSATKHYSPQPITKLYLHCSDPSKFDM